MVAQWEPIKWFKRIPKTNTILIVYNIEYYKTLHGGKKVTDL